MTGHGQADLEGDAAHVQIEMRSINNRFLKTIINGDLDPGREAELESLIRSRVSRGNVSVRLRITYHAGPQDYRINTDVLSAYQAQLADWRPDAQEVSAEALLGLPGVVEEGARSERIAAAWPTVRAAAEQALDRLIAMRQREGEAMQVDLLANCQAIDDRVAQIRLRAPAVVEGYARRITERINQILAAHDVAVEPADLLREVGVFAERVDISEELVRLASHLEQFREIMNRPTSDGRKLEFLTQELLRETNTIGAKANDAEIAAQVVEIKALIERIREMVQNVE